MSRFIKGLSRLWHRYLYWSLNYIDKFWDDFDESDLEFFRGVHAHPGMNWNYRVRRYLTLEEEVDLDLERENQRNFKLVTRWWLAYEHGWKRSGFSTDNIPHPEYHTWRKEYDCRNEEKQNRYDTNIAKWIESIEGLE